MSQPNTSILVPYDDFAKLRGDSMKVEIALSMLYASFPDEECRMTALKSTLGYSEPEPDPDPEPGPDPEPDPSPLPDDSTNP